MDVQVRVVDVDVPAQQRPHIGKRGRMIDKAHDLRAVGDGTEPVQRVAGCHESLGFGRQVSPVEGLQVIQHLIMRQRASDDQIAVLLESLAY
jgi:hypothetical protein